MNKVDDIIVVGGGNAGYISALILKQSFPYKSIKIIESKSIGTIGVGESSSEQFAQFCSFCNISSLDLILRAKATFKNGIYFKDWSNADYLFKDGSMIGLNDKLLQQYVEWVANRRLRSIALKPQYDIPAKNNPLPWTEQWISSKGLQVAPQETEVESYVVGGIKQDVKKDTFSGFKI